MTALTALVVTLPLGVVAGAAPAAAAVDLARDRHAWASASQDDVDGSFPAQHAVDGDPGTRWASGNGADAPVPFTAWWAVDLGAPATVERVSLVWESAFATSYDVQVADDAPDRADSWTTVHSEREGDGGTDHITLDELQGARYVRVAMLERAPVRGADGEHRYGYSLFSAEVWGTPGQAPSAVLEDFGSGVPGGYAAWSSREGVRPVLTTVPSQRPGALDGNYVLRASVPADAGAQDWFGFTDDLDPTADWSGTDGFSVWFRGEGRGGTLRLELKSHGRLFEHAVVDDDAGWRRVTVMFADVRLKGDAASSARFDPRAAAGFAVTLTDLGPGDWHFDDVSLVEASLTLQSFDGQVPLTDPYGPGLFAWRSDGAQVSVGVAPQAREGAAADNKVLMGSYVVPTGGYGGVSHNLAVPQDWSRFGGLRFYWYASQEKRPASSAAGAMIEVEIKDGGPDGEHTERWVASFRDNWSPDGSRWKLVELPFHGFVPDDHQTGDAATLDGRLSLTTTWGYGFTFPAGTATPVAYAIDDVQVHGRPAEATEVEVRARESVVLTDPGTTAGVPVVVVTAGGQPLAQPVTVDYRTVDGTAAAGTHYASTSGTLTFAAGTPSGSEQVVEVATQATPASDARSLTLELTASGGAAVTSSPLVVVNAHGAAYLDASLPTEQRVDDLLRRMTLAEKVGQMTQGERAEIGEPTEVARLGLGSLLSGGGSVPEPNTPEAWADMVDDFQRHALSTRLQIPLLYGVDAVHGHSNVVGATILPHNIGLGASRSPDLVRRAGQVSAAETRATGVPWTFAPCLCVTRDERWGRSYEAFGEDPALVQALARPAVVGLQGEDAADLSAPDRVLATAKHWVGDGGTSYDASKVGTGYPIDQGVTRVGSLDELVRLHVRPYEPAVAAGVGSIMPSYSGVSVGGGPVMRMHEHRELNTGMLKGDLGFDGFLVSDWEAIDLLPGDSFADKVARSINSGVDMAMEPYQTEEFVSALTSKVEDGTVSEARVDDAVRRILRQKLALGLFDQPWADRAGAAQIGSADHRAVAREAAAASQVLLKNAGVLPLRADQHLYVAGSNADDLGHQMGGWSISWQGSSGDTTVGTSILEGIREVAPSARITHSPDASAPTDGASVGVVVVGEPPYAEGIGDVGNNGRSLELTSADSTAIDRVCGAMPCVVVVVSGRPQVVTGRLGAIDGLVASWLPGSEGAGVADVLFGQVPFTGRLPVSWPRSAAAAPVNVGDATYDPLYPYGWGLRTDPQRTRVEQVRDALPAGNARTAVEAVLAADVWAGQSLATDGARRDRGVRLLVAAAVELDGTADDRILHAGLVVSVLRDVAQGAAAGGAAPSGDALRLTADAEHELMSGRAGEAARLLARVGGVTA